MVDYTKIYIFDKAIIKRIERLSFINKVNYNYDVNYDTGEIRITHYDNYKGITFKWDAEYKLIIEIKPHYYFNDNIHNANDFRPTECISTFKEVFTLLRVEDCLNSLKIVGLEYGINWVSSISDTKLMDSLMYHSVNSFYNIKDLPYCKVSYKPNKKGKANQHKQLKLYSKVIQHPDYCEPNTARIEVRSNRSAYIKKLGIQTAADLLNPKTYERLRTELIDETKQLILDQKLKNLNTLTPKRKAKIKRMNKPKYWRNVHLKNKPRFTRLKAQYFKLLNRTGFNLTNTVIDEITHKVDYLFS